MTTTTADLPPLWVERDGTSTSPNLLAAALAIAGLVHLILILTLNFVFPKVGPSKPAAVDALEIIVLRQAAPSEKQPEIADAFAQVDREGGGLEEVREADDKPSVEPIPEIPELEWLAQPIPPPLPETVQAFKPQLPGPLETQLLTATLEPESALLPDPRLFEPPEESPLEPAPALAQLTAADILASRNLEIAELTARIRHSSAAYANRPRRKAISTSTRELKYASYLEAWRRKVLRVGNLNYPEEARRRKMYGNLILHVALRADGSIERIRVLRSSGFDLLDEAAVKIVELAAPFAPFPPDIRTETDILDITRTWRFLSSNRLGWEN